MPRVRRAGAGPLGRTLRRPDRLSPVWPRLAAYFRWWSTYNRSTHAAARYVRRPLRNLRLSVTDRCNLRCAYCMPEKDYVWLPREDVLRFEEISTLVDVFVALGVEQAPADRRRTAPAPRPARARAACSPPSPV